MNPWRRFRLARPESRCVMSSGQLGCRVLLRCPDLQHRTHQEQSKIGGPPACWKTNTTTELGTLIPNVVSKNLHEFTGNYVAEANQPVSKIRSTFAAHVWIVRRKPCA
jgi:hypothetical protein